MLTMIVYSLLNMDDLTQHRKARLKALISGKPYEGNQAEFGRRAGVTKARITQLLDESESFGERAAQSLCDKLDLPSRYFEEGVDTALTSTNSSPSTDSAAQGLTGALITLASRIADIDPASRDELAPMLSALVMGPDSKEIIEKITNHINRAPLKKRDAPELGDHQPQKQQQQQRRAA